MTLEQYCILSIIMAIILAYFLSIEASEYASNVAILLLLWPFVIFAGGYFILKACIKRDDGTYRWQESIPYRFPSLVDNANPPTTNNISTRCERSELSDDSQTTNDS